MSIYDLPDELLYEMCQDWDDRTLLNMNQSYSRVYHVCNNIIEQRKIKQEEEIQKRLGPLYGVIDQDGVFYLYGYSLEQLPSNYAARKCIGFNIIQLLGIMYRLKIFPKTASIPSMDVMSQYMKTKLSHIKYIFITDDEITFQYIWLNSGVKRSDLCEILKSYLEQHNRIKKGINRAGPGKPYKVKIIK